MNGWVNGRLARLMVGWVGEMVGGWVGWGVDG